MRLVDALRQIFPVPLLQSETSYVTQSASPATAQLATSLEKAAALAESETIKELLAHSLRYLGEEQSRGASIMSRGQALLVAQTFFGALLAFSTAMVGKTGIFSGYLFIVLAVLLTYTLVLGVLLTVNSLRAVDLLRYRRVGTSDLIAWVKKKADSFNRNLALETIANYRQAAGINSWRATHLALAQVCLRNIVFALTCLVFVVFVAMIQHDNIKWPASAVAPIPFLHLSVNATAP